MLQHSVQCGRWRILGGIVPCEQELQAKAAELAERLQATQDTLAERDATLRQIDGLASQLQIQAASGRQIALAFSAKVSCTHCCQGHLRLIALPVPCTRLQLSGLPQQGLPHLKNVECTGPMLIKGR